VEIVIVISRHIAGQPYRRSRHLSNVSPIVFRFSLARSSTFAFTKRNSSGFNFGSSAMISCALTAKAWFWEAPASNTASRRAQA
jgi:hypothetical protein